MADSIATPRLKLLPLTPSLLRAVAGGDLAQVERQLGAPVGKGWEEGVPAKLRLEQLAADPSEQPWLVRAMIASTPRQVVGCVGFHAPPNDEGRVEIGYDIVVSERRKGYAREGIRALLDWAWATGRVRMCVASVSPETRPPLPSSTRSGSGMSASGSTRSTDWSWSSSGACHSCPNRRRRSSSQVGP